MSIDRKAHQCRHPGGCDSEAQWALDLAFHTIGNGIFHHEIKCHSNIRVCGKHTEAAQQRLLSPNNCQQIALWMVRQNLPLPDFSSFEITWNRIDHDEIDAEIANEAASAELETELRT